jgi:hypothetical protein
MMREMMTALLAIAALTGCGERKEPQVKAIDDEQAIAMVERMNQTPFRLIRPQPLSGEDLARYDLARTGCSFRPGDDPDEPPLFVAQRDRGFLKIGGVLQPVAAKTGSAELPSGAHSAYVGLDGSIELVAQAGSEANGPGGKQAWPSRLVIHDAQQRVAFNAVGRVSCTGSTVED